MVVGKVSGYMKSWRNQSYIIMTPAVIILRQCFRSTFIKVSVWHKFFYFFTFYSNNWVAVLLSSVEIRSGPLALPFDRRMSGNRPKHNHPMNEKLEGAHSNYHWGQHRWLSRKYCTSPIWKKRKEAKITTTKIILKSEKRRKKTSRQIKTIYLKLEQQILQGYICNQYYI